MPEWKRTLPGPVDAEALAAALLEALTGAPAPPPLGFAGPADAGVVERTSGALRLRESWDWQITRDDEILACKDRAWDAAVPEGRFALTWAMNTATVAIVAEGPAFDRAREAMWRVYGTSEDERDALDALARSAAFSWDVFDTPHRRLAHLRYTPMRLGYVASGDEPVLLATLDRLATTPGLARPATLATALVLALRGRHDEALAALDRGPADVDLDLCRADVLSRAARHDEAFAALPAVSTDHDQAHSAHALAVAVLRRAGRVAPAAERARALAALPWGGVWPVRPSEALAAAALLARDAGDAVAARAALDALGPERERLVDQARRGFRRPSGWFLLGLDLASRVATLTT